MNYVQGIQSQFLAALAMLEQSVIRCPDALWDDPNDKTKFWHIAYHALFYTHLYLQQTEADFRVWQKHRESYELMGPTPWPPHTKPEIGEPYQKTDILEYIEFCRAEITRGLAQTDLSAPSGFSWLPFTKFELQIYSIRHLQQHTGELMERLGVRVGVDVDWVGRIEILNA
ncbi:MAG: DinB family protein [Caldilineaceae bacterium]